jgi:predicted anti-sigma-YlaC factor YlaD
VNDSVNHPVNVACESAAAYVLGALPAAERSAFEMHLEGCPDCRGTIADLAGLPGLLARVSPDDLVAPAPVPDTLVPRLVREVRRSSRRRRLVVGALGAAAVVLAVLGTAVVVQRTNDEPAEIAMEAVVDSPVTARAALVGHQWGTEITMRCRYDDAATWSRPYALVAVDDTGTAYQIATWTVGPGKTATVRGSVPVPRERIDRLEVRTLSGQALLRLSP